jgi:hypothetical protein
VRTDGTDVGAPLVGLLLVGLLLGAEVGDSVGHVMRATEGAGVGVVVSFCSN